MIVEAKKIRKSFGNLEVLKGVDFGVEAGEVVAIMGASVPVSLRCCKSWERCLPQIPEASP